MHSIYGRYPIIFGSAADYEDNIAKDERIDALRAKMHCTEDAQFTRDYHDPEKRSISNGLTITLKDGQVLDEVVIEYPVTINAAVKKGCHCY